MVLRSRLGARAQTRDLRAHSSDLARIEAEAGVVLTGARHARDAGLDLVAPDAPVEAYLDAATAERLAARYALRPSGRPNVRLRVLPPGVEGWLGGPVAPRLAGFEPEGGVHPYRFHRGRLSVAARR